MWVQMMEAAVLLSVSVFLVKREARSAAERQDAEGGHGESSKWERILFEVGQWLDSGSLV